MILIWCDRNKTELKVADFAVFCIHRTIRTVFRSQELFDLSSTQNCDKRPVIES